MAKTLWCPAHGDSVKLKDGSTGVVNTGYYDPEYNYQDDSWKFEVSFAYAPRVVVVATYSLAPNLWNEVDD